MNKKFTVSIFMILFMLTFAVFGQSSIEFKKYHNPEELNSFLSGIVKGNITICKLHKIADTPGNKPVYILEIGDQIKQKRNLFREYLLRQTWKVSICYLPKQAFSSSMT